MLNIETSSQFRKDLKKASKQGKKSTKINRILELLIAQKPLPTKNRDHSLTGNYKDCRECHIEPGWLLIYMIYDDTLKLVRTGSHSELF
jgi:mRNA interferase YafQ